MTYNFLYCVNRLCHKFNEVPLDSSTFASAEGIYSEIKDAVNAAQVDIYKRKNNEWPFSWQQLTFNTVAGQNEYTKAANAINIDWDSFEILKSPTIVDSIVQVAGLATVTIAAGHNLQTNDYVYVFGADQSDYNGHFYINVLDATQFTFSVSASAVTPATGTIAVYPPYGNKKLNFKDYDAYRGEGYQDRDNNAYEVASFGSPDFAVRKTNNNIILSPKPDRVYSVQYDSFTIPVDMELYNDIPSLPEAHKEVLVDAALWAFYMFRDNVEEAALADTRYEKSIETMARMLIPQQTFMRIVD